MFIVILFFLAKMETNCISINKRMDKLWHMETIKYYIKIKIELHIPKRKNSQKNIKF